MFLPLGILPDMFRDSMTSTGYPLHPPVSPSLPPSPHVRLRVPLHFNCTVPTGQSRSDVIFKRVTCSQHPSADKDGPRST